MGVYVPNMEIPSGCPFCWLSNWERCRFLGCNAVIGKNRAVLTDKEYADSPAVSRPDWCPLIPVSTPHGRLIDADALMVKLQRHREYHSDGSKSGAAISNGIGQCLDIINGKECPTIIQAEEAQP